MESPGPGWNQRACCTKWENPMENPPSNRFFLQFGFSDHGYTNRQTHEIYRLLYKLETDDEALAVAGVAHFQTHFMPAMTVAS